MKRFTVVVDDERGGSLVVADFHTKKQARQFVAERSKFSVQKFDIEDAEA